MFSEAANSRRSSLAWMGAMAVIFIAPTITFFSRHSPPVLIAIAGGLMMASLYFSESWKRQIIGMKHVISSHRFILLACMSVYACVSVAWSPSGAKGLLTVLQTISGMFTSILLVLCLKEAEKDALAKAMITGLILCASVMILDAYSVHWARHIFTPQGRAYDSNRAAVLLALSSPMLLGLIIRKERLAAVAAVALALSCFGIAVSFSESAKLALVVSLTVFVLLHFGGWAVWRYIAGSMIICVALAPLIYGNMHDALPGYIYKVTPYVTVEVRTRIWEAYAQLIAIKPFFGFGATASETAYLLPEVVDKMGANNPFLRAFHPHGIPLQIWVELGLAGIALTVAISIAGLKKMKTLAPASLPWLGALIAAALTVSAVGHGMWQAWWPCVIGYAALGFYQFDRSGMEPKG